MLPKESCANSLKLRVLRNILVKAQLSNKRGRGDLKVRVLLLSSVY